MNIRHNHVQYLIIKKLAALSKISVLLVMMLKASIIRGAKIENILNFKNDYPILKAIN